MTTDPPRSHHQNPSTSSSPIKYRENKTTKSHQKNINVLLYLCSNCNQHDQAQARATNKQPSYSIPFYAYFFSFHVFWSTTLTNNEPGLHQPSISGEICYSGIIYFEVYLIFLVFLSLFICENFFSCCWLIQQFSAISGSTFRSLLFFQLNSSWSLN